MVVNKFLLYNFPPSHPFLYSHCLCTTVPGAPSALEGEAVGSNGILLSWTMPPDSNNIDGYVIR